MTSYDLVIRNGTVATAADIMHCDIGIQNGKITAYGRNLALGVTEIDATDKLVLPGGVDAHCHMDQPMSDSNVVMADDFYTGTLSAACGGTTTVIPFACQMKGGSLKAAVEDYHQRANGKAIIDYAFHLIVSDPTPEILKHELPSLVKAGYTSFKIYMTHDDLKLNDYQLLSVLALARREGALTMVHAENTDCIAWMVEQMEEAGKILPYFHAVSRPMVVEREATHRAIALSEIVDVPILLVHVSGREAVEQIQWAQNRGLRLYAETCPQYLLLTEDDLGHDFEGAKCVCSPPPRDKANQQVIWDSLGNGVFQIFSSDHAPFRYNDPHGKQVAGKDAPFRYVPNGIPGIETRLPLLFSEGVGKGRIDLNQFVALTSTNPAKLYGLYPCKGTIAVGSDADLVIWDVHQHLTITNAMLHHNVDYTPYEGMEIQGYPETTISRGQIVCQRGKVLAKAGRGQFFPCGLSSLARPKTGSVVKIA